jgi:competence protein ComFC
MQVCIGCGRLSERGEFCQKCRFDIELIKQNGKKLKKIKKRKPLQGIITASYFEEGPIREMIHNFKYNSALELKKDFGELLFQAFQNSNLKIEIITFTPLHIRRLNQRGYNQSELLARELSLKSKIPAKSLLKKRKNTLRQVELKGDKRRKNLEGVFAFEGRPNIKGKNILIIDDIATTGTTLNECAKVLKKAGAKKIWGLVVARG